MMASQCMQHHDQRAWSVQTAPGADEIVWNNLKCVAPPPFHCSRPCHLVLYALGAVCWLSSSSVHKGMRQCEALGSRLWLCCRGGRHDPT